MSNDAGGHQGPTPVRGSRRSLARGHRGHQRAANPESLVLEIVCAPDGWPDHGEQVLIRRSRSLTDDRPPPYDETMPRQRVTPHQLRSETGGTAKDEGTCPKCGARPRLSSKTVEAMFDAMQAAAAGKESLTWRWDFRKQRLLS